MGAPKKATRYTNGGPYGKPVEQLFLLNAVGPEKNLLTPLIEALEELSTRAHRFGRKYSLNGEPKPQMLFVDLKLNEDIRI